MIVLDASAAVDLMLDIEPVATELSRQIDGEPGGVHAPHLLDAEVTSALRRFTLSKAMTANRANRALERLRQTLIVRYAHGPLRERAFKLRENVTIYDGLYIALAETLGATLLTRDGRLARVPGVSARVSVI